MQSKNTVKLKSTAQSKKVEAYEKLGAFYLGRPWDPDTEETASTPLLYESRDLTTHAVCVGMTGSGKTGLCVTLLEEAAIDGIPALIIDVKGDLGNLLLTFPDLEAENFRPWVDESIARREGVEPDVFAQQQADLWRKGLGQWDQDGDRIRRLRDTVDMAIYTPGSEAGLPISILSSFDAPSQAVLDDYDAFQERVGTTVSGLLGLLGIDADPLRSREHILLSNLLDRTWREGKSLDMAGLIQSIQEPPFERIGVMALESFYPSKDRFELAMSINNLLAAPGFQSWLQGQPLDIGELLYDADGKPRLAIFSIAHLNDAERMFFVSLLLNQTLGWMRGLQGTGSLRAILYMDEIYGYLPPVANPPSKGPMLTLLKQARAFGLGLVLATQNPVDLDYKALSNIGTWFLGRLQTERDQKRVLDGLEGAAAEVGLTRSELQNLLSNLGKRVFLLHDVHADGPALFRVRWAMSYLCGPLTRGQIQTLMADRVAEEEANAASEGPARLAAASGSTVGSRPVLPPNVPQVFLPLAGPAKGVVYEPCLVGTATVHFVDKKSGEEIAKKIVHTVPCADTVDGVDWFEAESLDLELDAFEDEPADDSIDFAEAPGSVGNVKHFTTWKKGFADALYRNQRHELFVSPTFKLTSTPEEGEREFRIRLSEVAREKRDEAADDLRERYAKKLERIAERIRRAEEKVEKEEAQAADQKRGAFLQVGSTLLGALLGGKTFSKTNLNKARTAMRGFSRSAKEGRDVELAEGRLKELMEQHQELEDELENELDELADRFDPQAEELETKALKPRRTDVRVQKVALAWAPWRDGEPAW